MRKKGNINNEATDAMDQEDMAQFHPGGEEDAEERATTAVDTDESSPADDEDTAGEPEQARPTLKEVIEENAREDEKPFSSSQALRTILGGDILNTQAIRKQIWLFLIITVFAIQPQHHVEQVEIQDPLALQRTHRAMQGEPRAADAQSQQRQHHPACGPATIHHRRTQLKRT